MKTRTLTLLTMLCLVGLMGCGDGSGDITGPGGGADGPPEFELTGPGGAPHAGEDFSLNLDVRGLADFRAANLELLYDREQLELLDVHCDPDFLGQDGFSLLVHTETGASIGLGRTDPALDAESGVLLEFEFRARREGTTGLELRIDQLVNSRGAPCHGEGTLAPVLAEVKIEPRED